LNEEVENLKRVGVSRKRNAQAPCRQDPEGPTIHPWFAAERVVKAREGKVTERKRSQPGMARENPGEVKPKRATASTPA